MYTDIMYAENYGLLSVDHALENVLCRCKDVRLIQHVLSKRESHLLPIQR